MACDHLCDLAHGAIPHCSQPLLLCLRRGHARELSRGGPVDGTVTQRLRDLGELFNRLGYTQPLIDPPGAVPKESFDVFGEAGEAEVLVFFARRALTPRRRMRYVLFMRFGFSFVVSGLFLIGCSSDNAVTGSPSSGSGGSSADSGPSNAGGSPEASAAGGSDARGGGPGESRSPDADGPPAKSGFVGAGSYATDTMSFANSVGAGFFDGPGSWFAKGCQREVSGACWAMLCDYTNGGNETPPTGAVVSAGAITVGGTTPRFSLTYDVSTMKYGAVPMVPTDQPLYAGGTTITFTAAGADVPAFSDSLVTPTPFAITSPSLAGGTLAIDTGKDLVFAWSGGAGGILALNIRTTTTGDAGIVAVSFVSCQFKASAQTATIPTAQLQKLTRTGGTTTALIGTDLSSTKEIVAGGYMIHLATGGVASKADGTPYASSQVTIF